MTNYSKNELSKKSLLGRRHTENIDSHPRRGRGLLFRLVGIDPRWDQKFVVATRTKSAKSKHKSAKSEYKSTYSEHWPAKSEHKVFKV